MTLLWSAQSKAYSYFDNVVEIGTITVTFNRLIAMIIAAFLVVLLYLLLFRTDFGVSMRSVIQDPNLASLLGLNINSIFAMAFILSSAIAGVSGVLISMTVEISPFMGVTYVILAFVITAIGGVGNPIGSLAGGLILGLLDVLIGYTVGPGLNLFIVYSLLVAILVVRPKGLLGRG
jgi:branched-chain amino acid transport system permease protein